MENAAKNTFLWERGREAEQDLGALTLEGWCTYTNTHTDTHTCAPVAAGGRWASGSLQATHMLWLWAKMWPWLTTAFSTFATWSLQSWQVGTTILPSCWFPVTWCPKQAGTVKDLVLPHHCPMAWRALPPAHHLPSASGTSVLQGCSAGGLCEIEMCLQSLTPSSQILAGCCVVPALFSVPWLWTETSPLFIQRQHHGSAESCTGPLSPHDYGLFWVGRIIKVFPLTCK